MTDMNSFERRLADELEHVAGPRRPVDARAIRLAATTTGSERPWSVITRRVRGSVSTPPSRAGFSMSSALVYLTAAAILALFGGLLLAGLLTAPNGEDVGPAAATASPVPASIATLPTGAATEAIAPGIVRLLDDGAGNGHRQWIGDELIELGDIHVGTDGSAWVLMTARGNEWYLWQIGVPGWHETTFDGFPGGSWWGTPLLTSTSDGRLWAAGSHLASFDGQSWSRYDPRGPSNDPNDDSKYPRAITVSPDGTLWVAWFFHIGRLDPDGWAIYGPYDPPNAPCNFADFTRRIVALSDGSLVAGGPGCLARFDGDAWHELESPVIAASAMSDEIRVGGDGVLWAHINTAEYPEPSDDYLARLDGDGWSVFPVSDGAARSRTVGSSTVEPGWKIDGEGVVWLLSDRVADDADPDERRLWSFDGTEWTLRARDIEWFTIDRQGTVWTSVGSGTSYLDGDTWRRYPRVRDVYALDVAGDGTVWALGEEHSIYVIDPDAPTVDGASSHLTVSSGSS